MELGTLAALAPTPPTGPALPAPPTFAPPPAAAKASGAHRARAAPPTLALAPLSGLFGVAALQPPPVDCGVAAGGRRAWLAPPPTAPAVPAAPAAPAAASGNGRSSSGVAAPAGSAVAGTAGDGAAGGGSSREGSSSGSSLSRAQRPPRVPPLALPFSREGSGGSAGSAGSGSQAPKRKVSLGRLILVTERLGLVFNSTKIIQNIPEDFTTVALATSLVPAALPSLVITPQAETPVARSLRALLASIPASPQIAREPAGEAAGSVVLAAAAAASPRPPSPTVANDPEGLICDVWDWNLAAEFKKIARLVDRYHYISIDTEFPGVVVSPARPDDLENAYAALKFNVNLLKVIQLGLTFSDAAGSRPAGVCTWQFNFKFDLATDVFAQSSIDFLEDSGMDFAMHRARGICMHEFGELVFASGLATNKDVKWISFHGSYDFAYLYKLLVGGRPMPDRLSNYTFALADFFPSTYDIKYILRALPRVDHGASLQKLAEMLNVRRLGREHQAGSDSLITADAFFKLVEEFFDNRLDDDIFASRMFGLATPPSLVMPKAAASGGGRGLNHVGSRAFRALHPLPELPLLSSLYSVGQIPPPPTTPPPSLPREVKKDIGAVDDDRAANGVGAASHPPPTRLHASSDVSSASAGSGSSSSPALPPPADEAVAAPPPAPPPPLAQRQQLSLASTTRKIHVMQRPPPPPAAPAHPVAFPSGLPLVAAAPVRVASSGAPPQFPPFSRRVEDDKRREEQVSMLAPWTARGVGGVVSPHADFSEAEGGAAHLMHGINFKRGPAGASGVSGNGACPAHGGGGLRKKCAAAVPGPSTQPGPGGPGLPPEVPLLPLGGAFLGRGGARAGAREGPRGSRGGGRRAPPRAPGAKPGSARPAVRASLRQPQPAATGALSVQLPAGGPSKPRRGPAQVATVASARLPSSQSAGGTPAAAASARICDESKRR